MCEVFYVENSHFRGSYFQLIKATLLQSDSDQSDFEVEQVDNGDSESNISISTVNTEDLSNLSFSEDDGEDAEVGWSHDPAPVNVTPFTSRTGAVNTIPEDGFAIDFFNLFVCDEVFEAIVQETNRYARQCCDRKPDPRWRETSVEEMKAYFGLNIVWDQKTP